MIRILAISTLSLTFACATGRASTSSDSNAAAPVTGALASIEGRSGSALVGTARFTSDANGVMLHLVLTSAPPGEHGVHVHEIGDCSDPKAASAGRAL